MARHECPERSIPVPLALANLDLNIDASLRAPASDPSTYDDVARAVDLRKQIKHFRGTLFRELNRLCHNDDEQDTKHRIKCPEHT